MILKISLRAKTGVPKSLVKQKLRLHSLYFPQNTLMLTESREEFSDLHSIFRLCALSFLSAFFFVLLLTPSPLTIIGILFFSKSGEKSDHSNDVLIGVIRSMSLQKTHEDASKEFSRLLEQIVVEPSGCLLITGDFNFHMDDPDNANAKRFADLLESYDLKQHVNCGTHASGHTLDLVITRSDDSLIKDTKVKDPVISDHLAIHCVLSIQKPMLMPSGLENLEENFFDETSLWDMMNIAKIHFSTNRANNTRRSSFANTVLFQKCMKPKNELGVSSEFQENR